MCARAHVYTNLLLCLSVCRIAPLHLHRCGRRCICMRGERTHRTAGKHRGVHTYVYTHEMRGMEKTGGRKIPLASSRHSHHYSTLHKHMRVSPCMNHVCMDRLEFRVTFRLTPDPFVPCMHACAEPRALRTRANTHRDISAQAQSAHAHVYICIHTGAKDIRAVCMEGPKV